jgi:hypothetical protein
MGILSVTPVQQTTRKTTMCDVPCIQGTQVCLSNGLRSDPVVYVSCFKADIYNYCDLLNIYLNYIQC